MLKLWIKDGFLLKPHPIGLPWREEKEIDVDNQIIKRNIDNLKNKPNFLSLAQKNCFEYGYLNNTFKNYHDSRKTSTNSSVSNDFDRRRDDIFMRSKDNYNNSLLKNVCKKSVHDNRGFLNIKYPHSIEMFSKSNNTLFDNKNSIHSFSSQPTQPITNNLSNEDTFNYKKFPSLGRLNSSSFGINQLNQLPLSTNNLILEKKMSNDTTSSKASVNTSSPVRKNSKKNIPSRLNSNSSISIASTTGISSENIKTIFIENNLEKYLEKIDQHEIDMEIFLTLNRQDLLNVFEIKTKTEDNTHLTTMLNLIKYYKNLYNIT